MQYHETDEDRSLQANSIEKLRDNVNKAARPNAHIGAFNLKTVSTFVDSVVDRDTGEILNIKPGRTPEDKEYPFTIVIEVETPRDKFIYTVKSAVLPPEGTLTQRTEHNFVSAIEAFNQRQREVLKRQLLAKKPKER